jgi:UDP-GlcNAc:undecaprenyl-phosphate GlcNAc-1-phosphate transferase
MMALLTSLTLLCAFLACVLAIPLIRSLALNMDFVDAPGARKVHKRPVPPIGGIVIFAVFGAAAPIIHTPDKPFVALLLALTPIVITGAVDDYRGVPAGVKFAIHFLTAGIVVFGGDVVIHDLGDLLGLGVVQFGWFAPLFTICCIVYLINALNMLDGLDGLAGGTSLVVLIWYMIAAIIGGAQGMLGLMALLMVVLAAFLVYNMRHPLRDKACVFLGDAGSMGLGLVLAWFAIVLSQGGAGVLAPVSVAWILALPIIDAFALFALRLSQGRHPFSPDRRHLHHHFLDAGFSVAQATGIILCIGAIFGGLGYLGAEAGLPVPVLGWGWIALWLGHAVLVRHPAPFIRHLRAVREAFVAAGRNHG